MNYERIECVVTDNLYDNFSFTILTEIVPESKYLTRKERKEQRREMWGKTEKPDVSTFI